MNWWQFLLFPFAIIYDIITRCRNWFFDISILKTHAFPQVFTISVGNLSVGGTGKTPMVEYLIRHGLNESWQIATLSRGYGRSTPGVILGDENSGPKDLGDESYGYLDQFGASIKVVVSENRAEGMRMILSSFPQVDVVILDDAFQHRYVKPDFNILLTTFKKPFWEDFILPSGRLREARVGYKRADHILVTKCPHDISPEFVGRVQQRLPSSYLGFTSIKYGSFVSVAGSVNEKFVAVAAIANNVDFFRYVQT
ncbi:MAG: tetraacyldisaccharide 4'-kinase, partial [Cyclobacteriaceae bacterium]